MLVTGWLENSFKTLSVRQTEILCVLYIIMKLTEVFRCVYCSANAVSSRDGLDTETGTESLLSHRRERERERARRRARETEREYYQPGTDGSQKRNYLVISNLLLFSTSSFNSHTPHKSITKKCAREVDMYEKRSLGLKWYMFNCSYVKAKREQVHCMSAFLELLNSNCPSFLLLLWLSGLKYNRRVCCSHC